MNIGGVGLKSGFYWKQMTFVKRLLTAQFTFLVIDYN